MFPVSLATPTADDPRPASAAPPGLFLRVEQATAFLRASGVGHPQLGLVLGSGLGQLAGLIEGAVRIGYDQVPHLVPTAVGGHRGELLYGTLAGARVLAFCGRAHAYEGHAAAALGLGLRVLAALGAEAVVLTNAAGGLLRQYRPGDLMLIADHINATGLSPLMGPHDARLGPRFLDMTDAYCPRLRQAAQAAARAADLSLNEGVYVGVLGPNYETPAEVSHFARMGGHAVGMSTVLEAQVARHAGLRVVGISVITNAGAGLSPGPLSHQEVMATGQQSQARLAALLSHLVPQMVAASSPAGPSPASGDAAPRP